MKIMTSEGHGFGRMIIIQDTYDLKERRGQLNLPCVSILQCIYHVGWMGLGAVVFNEEEPMLLRQDLGAHLQSS